MWFGRPASIKHFKVFGRKCYIKNNDEHLGKYDDRDDERILLGYATNSKGYRCYNKRLHKLVDCIDIKVDESIPTKDIHKNIVELNTKDTTGNEEEQVQESEKEDSESDNESTDLQQVTVRPPSRITKKNHPDSQIISDKNEGVQTRRKLLKNS